jgi:3-isopropylmalate/(R)-2-methylmalate dehydratase small subunit
MKAIRRIRSRTVVLPANDIDTDQIIPARFLTTTSRDGFGRALFADWRFDAQGRLRPDFPLNRPEAVGCTILVAGNNFGCGSSREHAQWALFDFGIRAVVSTSVADIFRANALKVGLLPVVVEADVHRWLLDHPGAEVVIDVTSATLTLPDGRRIAFPLDPFARHCLIRGFDELDFLLSQLVAIECYERAHAR